MNFILDIDGTLWDTTEVVARAWNMGKKHIKKSGYEDLVITGDMLKKEFGKPMIVIVHDLFPALDDDESGELMEIVGRYEREVMESCYEDLSYPNVRETLEELSKRNNLYIVSNCRDGYIEHTMKRLGITEFIKDYECYGRTGLYKTDNLKLLMERNKIKSAVYVGDTLGDYISSKEAGLEFIHASYGFGEVDNPDYSIDKIEELLSFSEGV